MSSQKTLILEYDDFSPHPQVNCLKTVEKFAAKYPNIIINLFTTANFNNFRLSSDKKWVERVENLIYSKNISLCVHGFTHSHLEFADKNKLQTQQAILDAEKEFKYCNLPFLKVFRAPYWAINQDTSEVLEDLGYTHHYIHEDDRGMFNSRQRKIKGIIYNWNLKDSAGDEDFLIGHGHTSQVCGNGIDETFERVCDFIDKNNPVFKFADNI